MSTPTEYFDFEVDKTPRGFYLMTFPVSRDATEYLVTHTTDPDEALQDVDRFIGEAKQARKQLEELTNA